MLLRAAVLRDGVSKNHISAICVHGLVAVPAHALALFSSPGPQAYTMSAVQCGCARRTVGTLQVKYLKANTETHKDQQFTATLKGPRA